MPDQYELILSVYVPDLLDGASGLPGQAQPGCFWPGCDTEEVTIELTVE